MVVPELQADIGEKEQCDGRRDGVTYLQINDATGVVRAAVGRINETLWVLPMGTTHGGAGRCRHAS
ncbi:hypothetical protein NB693_23345 [Pantoea ananatis]|uniref:hypothetical protein n=1 Tax=Pantoea ananas TaxID=553 RepID=UPI00221F4C84|nr:hypothetical protein [Pantoea ananatis]